MTTASACASRSSLPPGPTKPPCAWNCWRSPASRMWSSSARRGPLSSTSTASRLTSPPASLQNVQDSLNDKAAYPLTGLAVAPDLVGISLSTTVEFKAGTSAEEKSLALSAAASMENLRTPGSHVVFRRQDQPGLSLHTALLPPCKSAAGRTPRNPGGAAQDA